MNAAVISNGDMPSSDTMHGALAARDARYDGVFVFGVITTGVYCRPSCPSRKAKSENVRFFQSWAAAGLAGLRPCKRCDPRDLLQGAHRLMPALAKYIDSHADQALPLGHLAREVHLSPSHLQRTFKAAFGVSPKAYHDAIRLKRFKGELKAGRPVLDSIAETGFQSTSRVYGTAARSLGMTPASYRAGGVGETIAYACRDTPLGRLLMAATDRGICFAQFGLSDEALLGQLREEFQHATLIESRMTHSGELDAWMEAFDAHVRGDASRPELPLDLRGTAFQIRIWRFLLGLAEGEVLSYSELASAIGMPKAVRAAASACAANRIAVLIPCHRVLRANGGLGGYRWGLERKRALLGREQAYRSKDD